MSLLVHWWCCAEYGRTGTQHDGDCSYALLGDRAGVLVQVKADYARLAHQHRGAVAALREAAERAHKEWDVADGYHILADAVWSLINAQGQ
jgi:hypothetical protein